MPARSRLKATICGEICVRVQIPSPTLIYNNKLPITLEGINVKKVWRKTFLSLLVTTVFMMPISALGNIGNQGTNNFSSETRLEGGWLEERNGVKILHLNGSYYEMGYQHGFFLKDEISQNLRARLVLFDQHGFGYDYFVQIWKTMEKYLPQEYKDEIAGMADGSGLDIEEIIVFNTMPAVVNYMFGCSELAVWGDATTDGKLYHVRGLDGHNTADPETGISRAENIVLIVRDPETAHASMCIEDAGSICCWSGINEKGISIGEDTIITNDTTFHGISAAFRMRMVLDYADTAEEAIEIMNNNRTCGWNFVISDGNVPIAYAIEQTANYTYVGTWDNAVEAIEPFWQIKDTIRRVNLFLNPELTPLETGRLRYDPSGLQSILWLLQGKSQAFIPWRHYYALSNEIENHYGILDLHSTMSMFRDEYSGKTDFLMFIINRVLGSYQSIFQFVACPENGDMVFSIANRDSLAYENPVHYVNLYNMLDKTPP